MSWYTPWTREGIDAADLASLKGKLEHAQTEIKRLTLDGLREIEWHERIRVLEEGLAETRTSCVPGSIWGHDLSEKSSPRAAAQFREAHEAKVLERLAALEAPPKDLSDPYPKDGPNVRNQNAHDALSKWLKGVDERLKSLEIGLVSTATGPRRQTVTGALSERLDAVEEGAQDTDNRDRPVRTMGVRLGLLDERLTALSETVAKNRKDHETLTELVASQAGQAEGTPDVAALERRVNGLDCDLRRAHERLDFRVGVAEAEEFCLSSGIVNVSADGVVRFSSQRRVSQRRDGPTDRRKPLIRYRRRSEDNRPGIAEIERRQYSDRRKP